MNSSHDISDQEIELILNMQGDNFLLVNNQLIKSFRDVNKALYLSLLLNSYQYHATNRSLQDGAFYLTHEIVQDRLFFSNRTIQLIKKDMINHRIIKTKLKGVPPKEYIWINFHAVKQLFLGNFPFKFPRGVKVNPLTRPDKNKFPRGVKVHPLKGSKVDPFSLYNKNQINKNQNIRDFQNNAFFSESESKLIKVKRNNPIKPKKLSLTHYDHPKNEAYKKLAKRFYSILNSYKLLNPKTSLKDIAKEFRLLCEIDLPGRGYDKIGAKKLVIESFSIYFDHITDQYWPQIYGKSSIRQKFQKLLNAIQRMDQDFKSNNSNALYPDKDEDLSVFDIDI